MKSIIANAPAQFRFDQEVIVDGCHRGRVCSAESVVMGQPAWAVNIYGDPSTHLITADRIRPNVSN